MSNHNSASNSLSLPGEPCCFRWPSLPSPGAGIPCRLRVSDIATNLAVLRCAYSNKQNRRLAISLQVVSPNCRSRSCSLAFYPVLSLDLFLFTPHPAKSPIGHEGYNCSNHRGVYGVVDSILRRWDVVGISLPTLPVLPSLHLRSFPFPVFFQPILTLFPHAYADLAATAATSPRAFAPTVPRTAVSVALVRGFLAVAAVSSVF